MVIAAAQSVVVHREAVFGSDEVKRIVSSVELFQPFDDGFEQQDQLRLVSRFRRSWPQAASMSAPLRFRTVAVMPSYCRI